MMKTIIVAAVAGAAAGQAARRAWQSRGPAPQPARPKSRHRMAAQWQGIEPWPRPPLGSPGRPPRTWADTREMLTARAMAAARRRVLDVAARAGVPLPQPYRPAPGLFGPEAVALTMRRRRDPYDPEG